MYSAASCDMLKTSTVIYREIFAPTPPFFFAFFLSGQIYDRANANVALYLTLNTTVSRRIQDEAKLQV